jgi:hypothetical protein
MFQSTVYDFMAKIKAAPKVNCESDVLTRN